MIQVFSKEWFEKYQSRLLWLLNTPVIKYWFRWCLRIRKYDCNSTINQITPNSFSFNGKYIDDETIEITTDFRTHDKYSKRLYFAFKPFWYLIHFFDWAMLDRFEVLTKLSFGFATLTVYPDSGTGATTVDGRVRRISVNETLSVIRSGVGTNALPSETDSYMNMYASTTTNQFTQLDKYICLFDTSTLTSVAIISAGVLSLNGFGKTNGLSGSPELDIVSSNPASNNTLVTGDYSTLGTTVFGSVTYASWSSSAYNDFTLDATGRNNISKTAISKFGARFNWDTDNNFTGTWANSAGLELHFRNADTAGTTSDPKLVVTYTVVVGPANLKSYNTNLSANIKSIDTNPIANIKSLNTNI